MEDDIPLQFGDFQVRTKNCGGSFPLQFRTTFFSYCFCIRGLRRKGGRGDLRSQIGGGFKPHFLTYLKQGIERNGKSWDLRPHWRHIQKGAAQCNCLSFECHIYNICCIYIYITYHVYIIWYVTYDGYHIEVNQFIIHMFLMQLPCRVSDAPLLFWLGYLPVYLAPFVFEEAASKFQFLWSPAKKPHPLVWKGLGKLVAIQISMVIIVVVVIPGDTVIQSDVSLILIHYQLVHFKVFSTLFETPSIW